MSQHKKLERVLDLLINENADQAEELLHDLVVEKARTIYESLVNEEDADEAAMDDDVDSEEIEEAFGGDEKEDFVNDIGTDGDDIETDELNDGEVEAEGGYEGGDYEEAGEEPNLEDKIDDISDQLEQLVAMFNNSQGMGDEYAEEPEMAFDMESELGAEGPEMDIDPELEGMYEATKLQDEVAGVPNQEGKLVGTGKNSKTGATGKEAPYTKAPTKRHDDANPVDFTQGSEKPGIDSKSTGDSESAKDDTPSSNIDVKQGNVAHSEQSAEGRYVGTGKNTKGGQVHTKSPLSKEPK